MIKNKKINDIYNMIDFIYENGNLYLPIYKIGSGRTSKVYFSINICDFKESIKLKKIKITHCAIKVFKDHSMREFKKEQDILKILTLNDKKLENINYPLEILNKINGITYETCACSVQELCELFQFNFDENIKTKIINDMILSVNNFHKCEYIHCDIKLDNFLVAGLNKTQNEIINFCKKYNFNSFYNINIQQNKKNKDFIKPFTEIIKKFQIDIINFYLLHNKVLLSDIDNESDMSDIYDSSNSEENESDNSSKSDQEENISSEYSSDEESVSTSCSSFISYKNEFYKKYDKFHTNQIINDINKKQFYKNDTEIINHEMQKYFIENIFPIIKIYITDYGLIKHKKITHTCQYINFRHPANALGLETSYENDLWALDLCIYELKNGKLKFNIKNHPYYGLCENNLLLLYLNDTKIDLFYLSKFKDIYRNKFCLKFI
jgi:serine/threonine protein kinase